MPCAYRIVKPEYADTAFDGIGAEIYGGRWNRKGTKVVYTSASPSLAVLETFVHMGVLPKYLKYLKYILIKIEIPSEVVEVYDVSKLPPTWKNNPIDASCQAIGTDWVKKDSSAVLALPSAVVDMEVNYLINPLHSDYPKIKEIERKDFIYDERMWKKSLCNNKFSF